MIMLLSGDNTPKLCDAASGRNQANWACPRSGSLFAQIGRSWRRKKKKFLAASAGSIQGQFVGYIFEIWLVFHWGVHSPVFHVYICLLIDSLLRDPMHCGQNKSHWLRSSGQQSFIQSSLFPVNGLLWSVVSTEWNPGSLFHLPCSLSALASKRTRWGQVIGLDLTRIHHFREHWARWTWRHFLTISSAWIFQSALSPKVTGFLLRPWHDRGGTSMSSHAVIFESDVGSMEPRSTLEPGPSMDDMRSCCWMAK